MRFQYKTCNLKDCETESHGRDKYSMTGCVMSGAWRSLQALKDDIAVIIHGARGCNNSFKLDYMDGASKTFNVDLNEHDVIFGGEQKLRQAILDIDTEYSPNLIVVLTSCCSELIGDDVDAVIAGVSSIINAKIFSLNTGGMSGKQQYEGQNAANLGLAKALMREQDIQKNTVNYLGYYFQWDYREGRDICELKRLLERINIRLLNVFTSGMSAKNIEESPCASLNIVRCPHSTHKLATYMAERFNTPYIFPAMPIGKENTTKFLLEVAEYFNFTREAQNIVLEESKLVDEVYAKVNPYIKGKKVAVCVGASRTPFLVNFLSEIGLDVKLICYYRTWDTADSTVQNKFGSTMEILKPVIDQYDVDADVLLYSNNDDLFHLFRENEFDLIFDARFNKRVIEGLMGSKFMESMNSVQPFMGYEGAKFTSMQIAKLLNNNFNKKYRRFLTVSS